MIGKKVLERLVKAGNYADWLGLATGYSLKKVAQKASLWGLMGNQLWSNDQLEMVIKPYREYASKQKLDEATVDSDLQMFAKKTDIDINRVRRVYHNVDIEPEEKPEKVVEEAEEELSEFDEEDFEEEEGAEE